jgi:predicted CXXCH cytochrome family protein
MATRETGKQRASRIPLDYYKRPNRMERWKGILALAALAICVGAAAAAWAFRDGGRPYLTRGPVAAVHAAWDNRCEACHADFRPMSKGSATARLLGSTDGHGFDADERCAQCHSGEVHHANQLEAMTPACGGCHREHRGRDVSLIRMADADCTQCHGNLAASLREGKTDYANDVSAFASNHPEFRSLKSDPGRLKFNHKLHMQAGQGEPGQAKPWTLGRIPEKDRARYRDTPWQKEKGDKDTDPVVLNCASCHRLDAGDLGIDPAKKPQGIPSAELTPRAAGAYMLPVNYAAHCAACHPLTFDEKVKGADGQPLGVPHGLQPDEVRDFVWGAYAKANEGKALDQRILDAAKAGPKPSRPLPGKLTEAEKAAREALGNQTQEAANFLFKSDVKRADSYLLTGKTSCGECHQIDKEGGADKVLPLQVNNVWLAHAKFSHVAHRAADCRLCHENAYADGPRPSTVAADVLIGGLENCRQCHTPAAGVRSDCTECHLYHNGDRSLQGLGAAARDPHRQGRVDRFGEVKQFLQGTRN